ncbi:MAG: hypothetical protein JWO95_252 [Verrucomicrobiales bacterium]|nr:hypothetical protein [Verrucomicrobiales bacterium]
MKNWLQTSRAAIVACVIGLFLIAGTARAATPLVTVTSPGNGLRTTNAVVTVRGTARSSDTNDPISFVTVTVNGNAQTASGTTNWQTDVNLSPGANTIVAQSTTVGNAQSATTTRIVTLNVFSTLTVTTNGNGSVVPNLNGSTQLVGSTLHLTAIAAPDWTFTGWTGSTNSTNSSLAFTMTENANLTANFTPHPLQKVRGVYNGLILNTNNINGTSSGSFNLLINKPDTYVLRINVGNTSGTATGRFDATGAADFSTRGRNPISGHIQLDLSGTSDHVTGDVTAPVTASMVGDRNVFDLKTNLCQFAGQYNMVIGTNPSVGGNGYANVFVDGAGNLRMNGVLADGKSISQSTTVSKDGFWPMFAAPYGANNGAFMGWINITNIPQSSLHGVSYWFHPASHIGAFTNEFSERQDVIGSLFIQPPANVSIMEWTDGMATVGGDDLPYPLSSHLTWRSNNTINVDLNDFTFQVTSFGNIRGTLTRPVNHRVTTLQGTILPKTNWAGGFFLDTSSSGYFFIGEDLTAGTNGLVQAPGDIGNGVLTLNVDKKTGTFAGLNTMTFNFGPSGTTTVTSSDIANFGNANFNYSSYVSTSANVAELNILGGTVKGKTVVIRLLLHFTGLTGQQGDFIATITAGGTGTATGTFTLP